MTMHQVSQEAAKVTQADEGRGLAARFKVLLRALWSEAAQAAGNAKEMLSDREAWTFSFVITGCLMVILVAREILATWQWNWFAIVAVALGMLIGIAWAGSKQLSIVAASASRRHTTQAGDDADPAPVEARIQVLQAGLDRTQRSVEAQRQTALGLLAALATVPAVLATQSQWQERVAAIGPGQSAAIGLIGLLGAGSILLAAGFWHRHVAWTSIEQFSQRRIEEELANENERLVALYNQCSAELVLGCWLALTAVLVLGLAILGLMN